MRRFLHTRHPMHVASVVGGVAVLLAIGVRAQQAPPPAARPLVPLAASSLVLNPDLYIGETVAMTATVEQVLSKTAFSVDQDRTRATLKDVLVIAPTLGAIMPPLNAYLTVVGEVVKFDPADIAKRVKGYTLDLAPDVIERYRGRPAVIATAVVDAALTDLAKRVLPPPTPAEEAFDKVMKQINATFPELRKAIEASDAAVSKTNAAVLKKAFSEAEAFFKARGTADATGWAGDALKFVDAIDQAAAAGKWDDVKASSTSLNGMCQTCHAAYRERLDDGTSRVRGSR